MIEAVQLHFLKNHERINEGLLAFALKLQSGFPDCSRGVMPRGWRSPEGQWSRGSANCAELQVVKRFVASVLPTDAGLVGWDFASFFTVMSAEGEILAHNNIEASCVVVYHVEGRGELTFQMGLKEESVATMPGLIAIFPAIMKNLVRPITCSRHVSLVLNAIQVRRAAA